MMMQRHLHWRLELWETNRAKSDGTIEEETSQLYLRNNGKAKMRTQIFHLSQKEESQMV